MSKLIMVNIDRLNLSVKGRSEDRLSKAVGDFKNILVLAVCCFLCYHSKEMRFHENTESDRPPRATSPLYMTPHTVNALLYTQTTPLVRPPS